MSVVDPNTLGEELHQLAELIPEGTNEMLLLQIGVPSSELMNIARIVNALQKARDLAVLQIVAESESDPRREAEEIIQSFISSLVIAGIMIGKKLGDADAWTDSESKSK